MTKFLGKFIHGVSIAVVVFSQYGGLIPLKYAGPVGVGISVAQAIVGALQHKVNEDGTPQVQPFIPK